MEFFTGALTKPAHENRDAEVQSLKRELAALRAQVGPDAVRAKRSGPHQEPFTLSLSKRRPFLDGMVQEQEEQGFDKLSLSGFFSSQLTFRDKPPATLDPVRTHALSPGCRAAIPLSGIRR